MLRQDPNYSTHIIGYELGRGDDPCTGSITDMVMINAEQKLDVVDQLV